MANYGVSFNGAGLVNIPSWVTAGDFDIVLDIETPATLAVEGLIGNNSANTFIATFGDGHIEFKTGSSGSSSTPAGAITVSTRYTVYLARVGSAVTWELRDPTGAVLNSGGHTDSASITWTKLGDTQGLGWNGVIERAVLSRAGDSRDYYSSVNTGSSWSDVGGGAQDGTLSGLATDGSQWVLLAASSPTITGPDTTTEGAVTVQAGTLLDTVVTQSLVSGSYSIAQTIDSATAGTLTYNAESGVNQCTPSTPVSGVPLEPTITAAGITPYVVQQKSDDGINPPATRNIALNPEATHEVVQAMIATSNVTEGESLFAPSIIDVEDGMQVYAPKVVNDVNVTYAADGTFTVDKDKSISIPIVYWSKDTGQWSCMALQLLATDGAVLTPFDAASYALRSYIRKVVFHSKLIITTRGRAEEYILHDAMTALGGASMSPPTDGVTPEAGWLGTQTVTEFEKRIAKLPSEQTAEVISDITTHLAMLGWA